MSENLITGVEGHSICAEMGIEPGDVLLSVNGLPIKDVFDYRFFTVEDRLDMLIRKRGGEEWLLEIEKDEDEDLGLSFERGLMDETKRCANKCVFCFVDQLPDKMRPTLYYKDDDPRLSFLTGNYVTLTNMTEDEFNRIIYYRLSPINISVHTTDPNLRVMMMKSPEAANLQHRLKLLYDAGLSMNYQVVLCKGINDHLHLERTIRELAGFMPLAVSLSVVPAGLTKYRDNLTRLSPFNTQESKYVLRQIESYQKHFLNIYKTRFIYAADEFYLNAGVPYPPYKAYEGFPQLENGVGMLALFEREFRRALRKTRPSPDKRRISLVTGTAAGPYIARLCSDMRRIHDTAIDIYAIVNHFFGENITVSGLLTGHDIIAGLKDKPLGDKLLVPANALRDGIFLDDVSLGDISKQLNIHVIEVKTSGSVFAEALTRS